LLWHDPPIDLAIEGHHAERQHLPRATCSGCTGISAPTPASFKTMTPDDTASAVAGYACRKRSLTGFRIASVIDRA
jgi:hypothetical protein